MPQLPQPPDNNSPTIASMTSITSKTPTVSPAYIVGPDSLITSSASTASMISTISKPWTASSAYTVLTSSTSMTSAAPKSSNLQMLWKQPTSHYRSANINTLTRPTNKEVCITSTSYFLNSSPIPSPNTPTEIWRPTHSHANQKEKQKTSGQSIIDQVNQALKI